MFGKVCVRNSLRLGPSIDFWVREKRFFPEASSAGYPAGRVDVLTIV